VFSSFCLSHPISPLDHSDQDQLSEEEEGDSKEKEKEKEREEGKEYTIFTKIETVLLDGKAVRNLGPMVNHSAKPNVEPVADFNKVCFTIFTTHPLSFFLPPLPLFLQLLLLSSFSSFSSFLFREFKM